MPQKLSLTRMYCFVFRLSLIQKPVINLNREPMVERLAKHNVIAIVEMGFLYSFLYQKSRCYLTFCKSTTDFKAFYQKIAKFILEKRDIK